MTKLKISKCDITQELKILQNSKCDNTQKLKMWQNSKTAASNNILLNGNWYNLQKAI